MHVQCTCTCTCMSHAHYCTCTCTFSVWWFSIHVHVYTYVCLSLCLSACLSVCLSVRLSDCLHVSVSACLSVCMSLSDTILIPLPPSHLSFFRESFRQLGVQQHQQQTVPSLSCSGSGVLFNRQTTMECFEVREEIGRASCRERV